jgi:hypothetical protein
LKGLSQPLDMVVISSHTICVRYSGSLILSATYDYEALPEGDPLIGRTREAIEISKRVWAPERALLLMALPFRTCQTSAVAIH